MFNKDGIRKVTLTGETQILANVELQAAVGCIVDATLGVTVDGLKIVKAGTPLKVDLLNRDTTPAIAGDGTNAMNAILLHDIDVTTGNANATALIFGFVNVNRIDTATQALVTTATANAAASKLITFIKA